MLAIIIEYNQLSYKTATASIYKNNVHDNIMCLYEIKIEAHVNW